jgi:hypothetical protein
MKTKIKEFFKKKDVQKQIVTWTVFFTLLASYVIFTYNLIVNTFDKEINFFLFSVAIGMGLMIISMMITKIIYRAKRKTKQSFDKLINLTYSNLLKTIYTAKTTKELTGIRDIVHNLHYRRQMSTNSCTKLYQEISIREKELFPDFQIWIQEVLKVAEERHIHASKIIDSVWNDALFDMWKEKYSPYEAMDIIQIEDQPWNTEENYHSCNHPMEYRFIDRDGRQRCSSCHKVINIDKI